MVNQIRPFPKEKVIPILETLAKKKRKEKKNNFKPYNHVNVFNSKLQQQPPTTQLATITVLAPSRNFESGDRRGKTHTHTHTHTHTTSWSFKVSPSGKKNHFKFKKKKPKTC